MFHKWGFVVLVMFVVQTLQAQQACNYVLRAHIEDSLTHSPLSGTLVTLLDQNTRMVASGDAYVEFRGLCDGVHTLRFEKQGYRVYQQTVTLPLKGPLHIYLKPLEESLLGVMIVRRKSKSAAEPVRKLSLNELFRSQGQTLGKMLENIPGVYSLSSGQSITKPIVRGLHSNRVLIVNNELRQEGQQWGVEHAPEIDAWQAREVQLINGPASLRYGSDALGGVIHLSSGLLTAITAPRFDVRSTLMSNGRGGGLTIFGEHVFKRHEHWVMRYQGSLRRLGNAETPQYVLGNTGLMERALHLGIGFKKGKWRMQLEGNDFYTQLGILTTSHIGNLTDLYAAFQRERPIDSAQFTYAIGAPRQQIHHQTIQFNGAYENKPRTRWEWQYALQRNRRQEFDRSWQNLLPDGSLKPALDFVLNTHQVDLRRMQSHGVSNENTMGLSVQAQNNAYYGAFLIPNFTRWQAGIYGIEQVHVHRFLFELGFRYDVQALETLRWQQQQLQRTPYRFHGPAALGAVRYNQGKTAYFLQAGSTWRAPHVNELFSYGVHHSAATFEIGDSTLKPERNYQVQLGLEHGKADTYHGMVSIYGQFFDQFIYLMPVFPATLTLRGAFPTFRYTGVDVWMHGVDAQVSSPLNKKWYGQLKGSYLVARIRETGNAPVGMPPARLSGEITRRWVMPSGDITRCYIGVVHTAQAKGLTAGADYIPPPKAYTLTRMGVETGFHSNGMHWQLGLGIENLFNVQYRDYLNRYRYFAHEAGRNVVLQVKTSRDYRG